MFYNSTMGGRFKFIVTKKKLRRKFYWKMLQKQVRQYMRECLSKNKTKNMLFPGLLHLFLIPQVPLKKYIGNKRVSDVLNIITDTPIIQP